jgi:hypothetical protein
MGLKFRRGSTAQQSGSLAFGEPYVNTTLGTLVVGGAAGDIILSSTGTGSTGNFGAISGSGLDITGNANIAGNLTLGGNITIGDNTSDSVNVVASLSSSLIPQTTNIFDLGSATKFWRDLYISTGSIKMVNPANNQVVTTITAVAGGGIQIGNVQISTSSIAFVDNSGNVTQNVAQSSSVGSTSNFATTSSFNSFTSSIDTTIKTKLNTDGVVSGSSQISHDSTTGYSANKHIDHTSVLISAGNGLSGGGDISSTRTLTLDTGSATFTTGVKTTLNSNTVVSGSSQITFSGISSLPTLVSGSSQITGISNAQLTHSSISIAGTSTALGSSISTDQIRTAIGNVVTGSSQIIYASISSIPAGIISGAAQITPLLPGGTISGSSQVTISSTNGYGTIINQALLTTSTPTFGNLTINGTITATGDITAFFTSDIRHKNNVALIDNALEKVNALNGVTWEWNDDVDEVTKQTPKTGLIAQDVLDVLPEVVKTRENGFLALDYSKMIGLLVEAIKEQDVVIQKLKSHVIGLGQTITVFEDRMKEKGLL